MYVAMFIYDMILLIHRTVLEFFSYRPFPCTNANFLCLSNVHGSLWFKRCYINDDENKML